MRVAALAKGNKTRISRQITYPAPVGGMNTRDPPITLPTTDSPSLVNWFPRTSYLELRGGHTNWTTGFTGNIYTLATYVSLNGTETLFAFADNGTFNATSSGAVGASVLARTNGKHQWVMFGDGTNNWLCAFNGTDSPAFYNGTTWTAVTGASVPAITGVTTTNLIGAMVYQGRMYLIEKDTLKFWYLPAGAVGGAATAFDLTAQTNRGGYLMAALSYTYDGGSGMDDTAIFLTSSGDAIVYSGTDPGVAANWVKKGTYYVGKPIGRRCMCKLGGDVLILTESGIVKMSAALNGAVDDRQFYISDKVRNTFNNYYISYGAVYGWEMIVYHKQQALIVNIPTVANTTSVQLVMNIVTGAWTQFSNIDAVSFGILNSQLFYIDNLAGASQRTRIGWYGTTDTGVSGIFLPQADTANFNLGSRNKKMIRGFFLNVSSASAQNITTYSSADGNVRTESGQISIPSGASNVFQTVPAYPAVNIGIRIKGQSTNDTLYWYGTTFVYEDGGIL